MRNGGLSAQAFDPSTARLSGEPVRLAPSLGLGGDRYLGYASFSVSGNVLVLGASGWDNLELTWFDRTGKEIGHMGAHKTFRDAVLSPDGRRVVAFLREPDESGDLWLLDVARDVASRFTFQRRANMLNPIWSPDGSRIVFASPNSEGDFQLYERSSDGSGSAPRDVEGVCPSQERRDSVLLGTGLGDRFRETEASATGRPSKKKDHLLAFSEAL